MSDERRNELQLLQDILGIETLVGEITHKKAREARDASTVSAIRDPFRRPNAARRAMGESIVTGSVEAKDHTHMHGRILDALTGLPISNAELEIWQTGLYEREGPQQPDTEMRGRFMTAADGEYDFYCLRSVSYPIPNDRPAGRLLRLLDRNVMRPAHSRFIVSAAGYETLDTRIFDRMDGFVGGDAGFAVKEGLGVDFAEKRGDPRARFESGFDFRLVRYGGAGGEGVRGATAKAP